MRHIFGGSFSAPMSAACRLTAPQMGITIKEAEDWWKSHLSEYEQATGGYGAKPPAAPVTAPRPPAPSDTILGIPTGTALVVGTVLLGGGVIAAVVLSK